MTARRRLRVAAAALGLAVLLGGCGLPLPQGVQRPGDVPAEQRLPQPISVLPPGPQPDAAPEAVVLGFLAAQSSARDAHGIARSFLAPAARSSWDDEAGVTVFDPRSVATSRAAADGDAVVVVLSLDVVGAIGVDGAARVTAPQSREQRYRLRQDTAGQWQLVSVPEGLTLSPAGRDRSYDPRVLHFLAPLGPAATARHLVADLVQLPATAEPAQQVVTQLLRGPSSGIAGSAETAVPRGTLLRSPVTTSAAGEVSVDLTGPADALPDTARADLSAQLVWTLREAVPDFTRLRLLVDGELLAVPGVGQPQPRAAWAGYAPDGPLERPPGLALVDGQLRSLERIDEERRPTATPEVADAVDMAVDSRRSQVAVLTADGGRELLTGPLPGPVSVAFADDGLRSPTWGSGAFGLFVLRTGSRPAVLQLPPEPGAGPVPVQVDGLPALDGSALLRVSRDGARVALVAGGVLQVGRFEVAGRTVRLVGLRRLAAGVVDVAWESSTVLQVLVEDTEPPLLPLLRLSVDGTSAVASGLVGVPEGDPVALAAYAALPLLVETRANRRSTVYSGNAGAGFQVELRDATRPAYPR